MAEPKRKKLEKRGEIAPPSPQKFICCRCGIAYPKPQSNFTVSHSPMYRGTRYLPFCMECVELMFAEYKLDLGGEREAMRRMCMKMDLYWSDSVADLMDVTPKATTYLKAYIAKLNMNRFVGKDFDDTLREEAESGVRLPLLTQETEEGAEESEEDVPETPQDVLDFWGPGLNPRQYKEYDARFHYLKARYAEDYEFTLGDETLLRKLAMLEVDDNYGRAAGASSEKNIALIDTLIKSANLKPTQKKTEEDTGSLEGMPLGVGIQKWEMERPLPLTPEELVDQNGLVKEITTWFFGHTSKMVGLKNRACTLYEEAMDRLRVNPVLYEEDDDTLLADLFSDKRTSEGAGNVSIENDEFDTASGDEMSAEDDAYGE